MAVSRHVSSHYYGKSANDVNIFIVLSESPLKIKKIAVYCFLISLLVQELITFINLKNALKNGIVLWVKSVKIDKICDVMLWTSG